MLLRAAQGDGVFVVTQPAHAALAGRLAAVWDDELPEGLSAAATHHDDVWLDRDALPRLSPAGGLPQTSGELSDAERCLVWSRAPELAAPLGPAAELWVLRHGARLHAGYDDAGLKAMVLDFGRRNAELLAVLAAESPHFDDAQLARGTALLRLFDELSLRLVAGVGEPVSAGVLNLAPTDGGVVTVAPWPFEGRRVETHVEGRWLAGPAASQAALDAAWAASPTVALPVVLVAPA